MTLSEEERRMLEALADRPMAFGPVLRGDQIWQHLACEGLAGRGLAMGVLIGRKCHAYRITEAGISALKGEEE